MRGGDGIHAGEKADWKCKGRGVEISGVRGFDPPVLIFIFGLHD
jgi:hypothetical protein